MIGDRESLVLLGVLRDRLGDENNRVGLVDTVTER